MGKPVLTLNHAVLNLLSGKRRVICKTGNLFLYLPNGLSSAVVVKLRGFIRDFCVPLVLG